MPDSLQTVNHPIHSRRGPTIRHYREADDQDYGVNSVVILSTNKVAEAVAADTNLASDGARILGVVKRAGRDTTDPGQDNSAREVRDVPVEIADDQNFLVLPIWHATAGTANAGEYSQYAEGFQCVLRRVGDTYVANVGVTANPNLQLVGKFPDIDDDELYALALWKVIAGEREEN